MLSINLTDGLLDVLGTNANETPKLNVMRWKNTNWQYSSGRLLSFIKRGLADELHFLTKGSEPCLGKQLT